MQPNPVLESSDPREQRGSPRFKVRVPVEFSTESGSGHGLLWNISASGARIELPSMMVPRDSVVSLRVSFFPGSFDVKLPAKFVRYTAMGFALRFTDMDSVQLRTLKGLLPHVAQLES